VPWKIIQISELIYASMTCKTKKVISLFCTLVRRSQLKGFIKFWALYFNKDVDILETIQRRSTSMVRDLEHTVSEVERIAFV